MLFIPMNSVGSTRLGYRNAFLSTFPIAESDMTSLTSSLLFLFAHKVVDPPNSIHENRVRHRSENTCQTCVSLVSWFGIQKSPLEWGRSTGASLTESVR